MLKSVTPRDTERHMAGGPRHAARRPAAALLAAGRSHAEVAAEVKVSARTLIRWRQEPGFRATIESARAELFDATVGSSRRSHGRGEAGRRPGAPGGHVQGARPG